MRRFAWTLALLVLASSTVIAHEGEDHAVAPGSESAVGAISEPVRVSQLAQRNLGLIVGEAELRPVQTTLRVIGEIEADPARSGTVASRIPGRVSAVYAQEGEYVEKGVRLVEVESLRFGDPPPRVRYASPVSGVVIDRHVVTGDEVEPNRHLFEVADLTVVLAVGRVFEGQIGQVAVGQPVRVRVPTYPDDVFRGDVVRLGGGLDRKSRSLAVYVTVANPTGRLRPHMRATLSIVTGGVDLVLAIPKSALLGEAGELFAFVQDDDDAERFERRPLVIGVSNDRVVEVIEGLFPGERVVVEGNYSLQYLPPIADAADEHEDAVVAHPHSDAPPWPALFWAAGALLVVVALATAVRLLRRPEAH